MRAESIRAILAGRKTQTRRVAKSDRPKYNVGDLLWVRETWRYWCDKDDLLDCIQYKDMAMMKPIFGNDGEERNAGFRFSSMCDEAYETPEKIKWRSPMFMPKWASRISLKVLDIRLERLHDITEADAIAEGVDEKTGKDGKLYHKRTDNCQCQSCRNANHKNGYEALWDPINGKKHPWETNPFVWVIEFDLNVVFQKD